MRDIRSPLDGIPSPFAARVSAAAVDAYLVGAYSPKVVADFAGIYSANEYYRTGGSASTFSDMFTYTGASNKTMVDSDGNLKWAPHNLATYSDEFDNAAYTRSGLAAFGSGSTANATTAPDGTATADFLREDSSNTLKYIRSNTLNYTSTTDDGNVIFSVFSKSNGTDYLILHVASSATTAARVGFNISSGTIVTAAANDRSGASSASASITSVGDGWYHCQLVFERGSNGFLFALVYLSDDGVAASSDTSYSYLGDGKSGVYLWGYHLSRASLGGMVNNPDRNDSYVPTTSSAVYLPRRNHYGWNGSSYVNKGLLLETESRTNLVASSDDMTTWTNSNTTDAKTETGADGVANSATLITATAGNGTILTTITAASANYVYSALVKRITGTGTVEMTIDGTNWVDVTSDINASQYTQVGTGAGANTTNPQIGLRLVTSGDEIAVQVNQLEATSGQFSSPMPTTGATFIRAAETLTIPAAKMAWDASNVSLQMQGEMTYADEGAEAQNTLLRWHAGATDYITYDLDTDSTDTGEVNFNQEDATGGAGSVAIDAYTPGTDGKAAYNISGRHTSTAINGATDGTATTEDTTPTALPDLSTTNFQLGYDYMGTIALFRQDNDDWGDAGIAEAST